MKKLCNNCCFKISKDIGVRKLIGKPSYGTSDVTTTNSSSYWMSVTSLKSPRTIMGQQTLLLVLSSLRIRRFLKLGKMNFFRICFPLEPALRCLSVLCLPPAVISLCRTYYPPKRLAVFPSFFSGCLAYVNGG